MTPHELNLFKQVKDEQAKTEAEEKITLAYMQALWTIQWLGKNKPEPLEKILSKTDKQKPKEMTSEEMLAVIKGLNASFGGTTY